MDNLTHSLVGVVLARSSMPWFSRLRGPLVAAIVANNLPDIDHAWLDLFEDPRLAYLLHHRGHTHTLALALPQAVLSAAAAKAIDKQARWTPLLLVSLVGVALHIFFDYLNNYGVPPFWPVHDRRHQGDTLFILDPYLWAILVPAGLNGAGPRLQRVGLLVLAAVGAAVWQAASRSATALWAIFAGTQATIWRRPRPAALAWGVVAGWLAVSAAGTARVRALLDEEWATKFPTEQLLDASIAPLPARPWCFLAVSISDTGGPLATRTYVLRTGRASLLPGLDPSEAGEPPGACRCPARRCSPTARGASPRRRRATVARRTRARPQRWAAATARGPWRGRSPRAGLPRAPRRVRAARQRYRKNVPL
jgi:inner membrane protein